MSSHHVPGRFNRVCSQVLHVGSKALIQPQVVPPGQRDQITEPLKGRTTKTAVRQPTSCPVLQMFVPNVPCEPARGQ